MDIYIFIINYTIEYHLEKVNYLNYSKYGDTNLNQFQIELTFSFNFYHDLIHLFGANRRSFFFSGKHNIDRGEFILVLKTGEFTAVRCYII